MFMESCKQDPLPPALRVPVILLGMLIQTEVSLVTSFMELMYPDLIALLLDLIALLLERRCIPKVFLVVLEDAS